VERALNCAGARVILANPQRMFVDTLVPVLENAGLHVAHSTTTRAGVLDAISRYDATLCLTAVTFADGSLFDITDRIRAIAPDCQLVVLSGDTDPGALSAALAAGVHGFVHTSRGLDVLLSALDRLLDGEMIIETSISRGRPVGTGEEQRVRKLATYLTPREQECLAMVVSGLDTAAMSRRLGVSRTTIRSHVQSMLMKLDVHSRLEAAALAVQHQLVTDSMTASSGVAAAL
jgi:DNA-binding NarL/FixJ family response regulator